MKLVIYSRPELSSEPEELKHFFGQLEANSFEYNVNASFAEMLADKGIVDIPLVKRYDHEQGLPADADIVISYGGDGTFLDSVRLVDTRPVPILGINSGRMGFLANVSKENMEEAFRDIREGKYSVEERVLLKIEGDFNDNVEYPYAFNEVSIEKSGVTTISVDVAIDGEPVTAYLGDGLILSTPSGSTAYALSVGGPIVAPNIGCFILAPIASHNLTMRPLVIPDSGTLNFTVYSRSGKAVITMDNRDHTVDSGSSFTVTKAKKSVFLIKLQNISFYRTLREKMMWGIETRKFIK